MKKLFLSLVAMMIATVSYSQNTLVATLSHGDNVTMYYGTYALRDAHEAAVSGDIINLSGGGFQGFTISKAITIQGTGIDTDKSTCIIGTLHIDVSENGTNRLSMEGVKCSAAIYIKGTLNNSLFQKCQFVGIYMTNTPIVRNAVFSNCKITRGTEITGTSSLQFINCYINAITIGTNSSPGYNSSALFANCIIMPVNTGEYPNTIINSQLINCIIYSKNANQTRTLPSSTIATNCVSIGYANLFDNSQTNSNCQSATFADVFKDFTGTYSDTQTFELTEEAKTKYLGTDGTEVGIYGGLLPYNSTPSYPQITKMNVANKTTADGKLSVEIEVSATE